MVSIQAFLSIMENATIYIEDSSDVNDIKDMTKNLVIHQSDKTYHSVEEIPNQRANVISWDYHYSVSGNDYLEIWCV